MGFFSSSKSSAVSVSSTHRQFPAQTPAHPIPAAPPARSVLRRSQKRLGSNHTIRHVSTESLSFPATDISLPPEYTDLDLGASRYPDPALAYPAPGSQVTGVTRGDNDDYHRTGTSHLPVITSALAAGSVSIVWDVRESPVHMRQPRHSRQVNDLSVSATSTLSRRLCIISHDFPWSIDVATKSGRPLTAMDIIQAVYESLDRELRRSEWSLASEAQKYAVQKANRTRRQAESAKHIRRVDWLGSRYMFRGLERDDTLARKRLMPGDRTDIETWVVRFGSR